MRSAVGYNEQRGDRVEVVTMRFAQPDEAGEAAPPLMLGLFERTDLVRLAEAGLLGLSVILSLMFVLRPMILRLTQAQAGPAMLASGPRAAAGPAALSEPGESNESAASADGQSPLRITSIRRVSDLVDAHPHESADVLRNWIFSEGSAD